jgi:hypothetical protein
VKIQKPQKRDGADNAASFYSREGYFGINVQVIVDKQKKILLFSIKSRGVEHDSTAFKSTTLYKWLIKNWRPMASKCVHFIGDLACSLKLFIFTPYDNAAHSSPEDNYNFLFIIVDCR